jgi:hypothetical protein
MFAAERNWTTPKTIFSIFKRGINGICPAVKWLNIQIKEGASFNIHHWSIFISNIGHNDPDGHNPSPRANAI